MTDDIVKRLRLTPVLMYTDQLGQSRIDYEACKKYINNEGVKMMRDAADEIERLRAVVEAWLKYSQRAERDIETLRKERDEARRETCYELSGWKQSTHEQEARAEAKRRGWNCFKEATDGK